MRNKRGYLGDLQGFINLDSLVDIVSNNVGILIILAVFMAMFSLLEKSEQVPTTEQSIENIEKLKIPWSHVSQKNNLLLLLRNDRLLFFDRALVYQRLKKYLSGSDPLPTNISLDQYSMKSQPVEDMHTVWNFSLHLEQDNGGIRFLSTMD